MSSTPKKNSLTIIMAFLIWSALVMGTFLLNSIAHFKEKLTEFGVW